MLSNTTISTDFDGFLSVPANNIVTSEINWDIFFKHNNP